MTIQKTDPKNIDEITILGAKVQLYWDKGNGAGYAVHTVPQEDLDNGTADGPNDGHRFTFRGEKYELGEHDYEANNDGTVTCSAFIYRREE
jgi:hypothetical protein